MKRPCKKPKEILENSTLIQELEYTSQDLRDLADKMESEKIFYISLYVNGYDGYLVCKQAKIETEEEADKRYNKELKEYNKFKEKQKQDKSKRIEQLKKEAKSLGLKIE